MNMQQILNDPELSKELDKAYELAAPYRARVQYRLALILQSTVFQDNFISHPVHGLMCRCFLYPGYVYINPILKPQLESLNLAMEKGIL